MKNEENNVLGVALTLLLVLAGLICVGISLTASQNTALATVVKLAVYVVIITYVLNVLSIRDLPQLMIARYAGDSFTWLALCAAYLTRFKAHKEAGEAADTAAEEKPAE